MLLPAFWQGCGERTAQIVLSLELLRCMICFIHLGAPVHLQCQTSCFLLLALIVSQTLCFSSFIACIDPLKARCCKLSAGLVKHSCDEMFWVDNIIVDRFALPPKYPFDAPIVMFSTGILTKGYSTFNRIHMRSLKIWVLSHSGFGS